MFYVPNLHQLSIPGDLKILIETSTNRDEHNRAKIMKQTQKMGQDMKRNQKTVEAAQIECKQKLNSDRKMEKLPAINAPYSVKLGVKGHIATNQVMPFIRNLRRSNELSQSREHRQHLRLKSQCSYTRRAQINKSNSSNVKVQYQAQQTNKYDPYKIAPWPANKITRFNFYQ